MNATVGILEAPARSETCRKPVSLEHLRQSIVEAGEASVIQSTQSHQLWYLIFKYGPILSHIHALPHLVDLVTVLQSFYDGNISYAEAKAISINDIVNGCEACK